MSYDLIAVFFLGSGLVFHVSNQSWCHLIVRKYQNVRHHHEPIAVVQQWFGEPLEISILDKNLCTECIQLAPQHVANIGLKNAVQIDQIGGQRQPSISEIQYHARPIYQFASDPNCPAMVRFEPRQFGERIGKRAFNSAPRRVGNQSVCADRFSENRQLISK